MALVLYHHPFSRAANTVWVLEELELPYELRYVDLMAGAQKAPDIVALNPMGKLPILVDGEVVVTESAAAKLTEGGLSDAAAAVERRVEPPRRRRRTAFVPPMRPTPAMNARSTRRSVVCRRTGSSKCGAMTMTPPKSIRGCS